MVVTRVTGRDFSTARSKAAGLPPAIVPSITRTVPGGVTASAAMLEDTLHPARLKIVMAMPIPISIPASAPRKRPRGLMLCSPNEQQLNRFWPEIY